MLSTLHDLGKSTEVDKINMSRVAISQADDEAGIAISQADDEATYLQSLVDDLKLKLNEATEVSNRERQRAKRMEIASFISAEDWKLELEAAQQQYQLEISHLQNENKCLKHEIVQANEAKEAALIMAREAMFTGENARKQIEFLSIELEKVMGATVASRQETLNCMQALEEITMQKAELSEAYAACQNSSQAGAHIVAEKEAELKKQMSALFQAKQEAELLRWELFESRKNETRLCETINELEILKMRLDVPQKTEEKQAKDVHETDIKLQEAQHECEVAIAAKNELAALLVSVQTELEDKRQNLIVANAEVLALTASMQSLKEDLETQLFQKAMLQRKNTEIEAKYLEALENLAASLAREDMKDEELIHVKCSLETSKIELQVMQQEIYKAVFDAQFSEVETIKELLCIHLILRSAKCEDLETGMLTGPCLKSEIDARGWFSTGLAIQNFLRDSLETIDLDTLPLSLEMVLAVCKRAALVTSFELKAMGTQLERSGKIDLELTSDPYCSCQETELPRLDSPAQRFDMEEALAAIINDQLQDTFNQEKPSDMKIEVQGKFRDLSEPWEIVSSGSESTVRIKKEEYDSLRLSIHEAMELQSLNESQLLSLRLSHQRLLAQLEAKNMEVKALQLSEQSMSKQYDQLQLQNITLEAEIRILQARDEHLSKSWAVDANALHCSRPILFDKQHSMSRDLSSFEREEEEGSEFLSLSSKKKKKALYLRIGTFLKGR